VSGKERAVADTDLMPVLVLLAWSGKGPRNVLVERADGTRVVRPFRGLRRAVDSG
jgi:hypothetical protein